MKWIALGIILIVATSGCISLEKIRACQDLESVLKEQGRTCECTATNSQPDSIAPALQDKLEPRCNCSCATSNGTVVTFHTTKPKAD